MSFVQSELFERRRLLDRIRQIEHDLRARDVTPEKVDLTDFDENELIEYGASIRKQLDRRKIFLGESGQTQTNAKAIA